MIDPVTGRFKITQYNDKRAISIKNLVDTMCWPDILDRRKSCMTKDHNLSVMS